MAQSPPDEKRPQSVEDLLTKHAPAPAQRLGLGARPTSVEELLAMKSGKPPTAPANEPLETLPPFLRKTAAIGVGVGVGLATGGLGFLPTLLLETAATVGTDAGLRAIGVKGPDEAAFAPDEMAAEAATMLLTGGLFRGAQYGLGKVAGIGKEGLEWMGRNLPWKAASTFKRAHERTEQRLATHYGGQAVELLKKRKELEKMVRAEAMIDAVDNAFAISSEGAPGVVNTLPLKMHIERLKMQSPLPEQAGINATLDEYAAMLPDRMTLRDFTQYIRNLRKPVEGQIGSMGKVPLSSKHRIAIAGRARDMRDYVLGTEGAELFQASSQQIDAIKKFRKLIMDDYGALRSGAEAKFKGVINTENHFVPDTLKRFQDETGLPVYDQAVELAKRRQWDPPREKMAIFILSMIARFARATARGTAKLGSTVLNPKLAPPMIGPTEWGQVHIGTPTIGAMRATGSWVGDKAMEAYDAAARRGKETMDALEEHKRIKGAATANP